MAKIPENTIKDILNKIDIVDVISNEIELIKKGKNYLAVCPFHNDTNPSMSISQEKQFYKCFSCGASGNAIDFLMNYKHISFLEAIAILAQLAGIDIDVNLNNQNSVVDNVNQEYYEITKEAATLFDYLLKETSDVKALEYLKQRRIDSKIIDHFNIGYNSSNNVLVNLLKSKNYDLNKAVELDLIRIYNNDYQDNYSERIIFPIYDLNNKIVGFSARALGEAQPKYLNSKDNKIFHKSNLLYNLNNAIEQVKKTKTIYIAEGPNDVIAFYRVGITNCVCVMGTAFTEQHVELLSKIGVKNLILAYDGDEAGQKATYHTLTMKGIERFTLSYVDFEQYDPDDYYTNNGSDAFLKQVNAPIPYLEFIIKYELTNTNLNNYEDKKKSVIKLVNLIKQKGDLFDIDYYLNKIANITDMSLDLLNSYLEQNQTVVKVKPKNIQSAKTNSESALDKASKIVLFFMMNDIEYFHEFNDKVKTFTNKNYRKLYNAISAYYLDNKEFDLTALANLKIDQDVIKQLTAIIMNVDFDEFGQDAIFKDSLATIMLESLIQQSTRLNDKLKITVDPIEKAQIAKEKQAVDQKIKVRKKDIFK